MKSASSRMCHSDGTYTPPDLNALEAILCCVNSQTSQSCLLTISKSSTASIGSKSDMVITSGSKSQSQTTRDRSGPSGQIVRSEEHTSELQSHRELVCRLL